MATGPTTLHWLAGCSAHQTQLAGALTPIAPTVVMKTKSGIFVLAAAGAWSSSRPSNPAASRDCGPFQQSPSTAHDPHAPAAIPHCRANFTPMSHRRRLPSANRNCQSRRRPPKRRSLTTRPLFRSCTRRPKPTPRGLLGRDPRSISKDRGIHRLNLHRPTPLPAQTPPRFPPLRLFGRLPVSGVTRCSEAGVRKPLTQSDVHANALAGSNEGGCASSSSSSNTFASLRSGVPKALDEPTVDRREQVAGFGGAALVAPQP